MSGAVSIPLAFAALFTDAHPKRYFAILAFIALWIFAIRTAWKNYQLIEANKKELKTQKDFFEKENQKLVSDHIKQRQELEIAIESLRTPTVEIEAIPCEIKSAQYLFCQIRIKNNSPTLTADNVRVELIALEDALETEEQSNYYHPALPLVLSAAVESDYSINPGSSLRFNLFKVTMNVKSAILKDGNIVDWRRTFTAYFTKETTKDLTLFHGNKHYRIKLTVTARDFPKIEQEFNLMFSDEGSFCRFTLSKIQP